MIDKAKLLKLFEDWCERLDSSDQADFMRLLIKTVIDKVKAFPEEENVHTDTGNRYIDNVNMLMKHQEAKGLATYGQLLQDNKEMSVIDRIEYLEEELVDALMYMEHLKESVKDINVPSKWIPVSERLPENEDEVHVTLTHTYDSIYRYRSNERHIKYDDGECHWCDNKYGYLEWDKYSDGRGGNSSYKVIAWQPLSEPYKGE